jgi:hypothetical protein
MACSDTLEEAMNVIPKIDLARDEENFVDGIAEGLKDFAKGRYTVFEDDDELEAHLLGL